MKKNGVAIRDLPHFSLSLRSLTKILISFQKSFSLKPNLKKRISKMKLSFKIFLILSQFLLTPGCLRTLDKTLMFNTSIQSTNNVYNHDGNNNYYGSKDLDLNSSKPGPSVYESIEYYNRPIGNPLGY